MLIVGAEGIAAGAGPGNELGVRGEPPVFAPYTLFSRNVFFALLPGRLYLLTVHCEADRSAERGSDQGRRRPQPEVGGHASKIRQPLARAVPADPPRRTWLDLYQLTKLAPPDFDR